MIIELNIPILACGTVDSDFDPVTIFGKRGYRYWSRGAQYAIAACQLASAGAVGVDPSQVGLAFGTSRGFRPLWREMRQLIFTEGSAMLSPMKAPQVSANIPAGQAAIHFGFRGANLSLTHGTNAGMDALLAAALLLRQGRLQQAIACGFEESISDAAGELLGGAAAFCLVHPKQSMGMAANGSWMLASGGSFFLPRNPMVSVWKDFETRFRSYLNTVREQTSELDIVLLGAHPLTERFQELIRQEPALPIAGGLDQGSISALQLLCTHPRSLLILSGDRKGHFSFIFSRKTRGLL